MMNIYFISGLGVDERIFSRLILDTRINPIHLHWISPANNESLSSYAIKLSQSIDKQSPFAIIGVSYGGMIAVEIAKICNPVATIIISSASTLSQIPWYYKLLGKLRIHRLMPEMLLKWVNPLTYFIFGTDVKAEKELLKQIIRNTNPKFLKWALDSILKWKNNIKPKNLIHIHGDNDKILPNLSSADYKIQGGTHFMVYQKAGEISSLINGVVLRQ